MASTAVLEALHRTFETAMTDMRGYLPSSEGASRRDSLHSLPAPPRVQPLSPSRSRHSVGVSTADSSFFSSSSTTSSISPSSIYPPVDATTAHATLARLRAMVNGSGAPHPTTTVGGVGGIPRGAPAKTHILQHASEPTQPVPTPLVFTRASSPLTLELGDALAKLPSRLDLERTRERLHRALYHASLHDAPYDHYPGSPSEDLAVQPAAVGHSLTTTLTSSPLDETVEERLLSKVEARMETMESRMEERLSMLYSQLLDAERRALKAAFESQEARAHAAQATAVATAVAAAGVAATGVYQQRVNNSSSSSSSSIRNISSPPGRNANINSNIAMTSPRSRPTSPFPTLPLSPPALLQREGDRRRASGLPPQGGGGSLQPRPPSRPPTQQPKAAWRGSRYASWEPSNKEWVSSYSASFPATTTIIKGVGRGGAYPLKRGK